MEKPDRVQVAVVRGGNRRGAVAQALSLIGGQLFGKVVPGSVIIPRLAVESKPGASTHPDAISATVDALLAAGAESITIAAAAPRSDDRAERYFDRLGYQGECWGRPVTFVDLADDPLDESGVDEFHLEGCAPICLPRVLANSDCRVSLTVAHGRGGDAGGPAASNLLSVLAASDRALLEQLGPLPGRSLVAHFQTLLSRAAAKDAAAHWQDLVSLVRELRPTLSVIDAFPATNRSGPRPGRWARPGMVVAGLDALAVDAVAASLLGAEPSRLGELRLAESIGLGVSDLERIEIVGDRPIRTNWVSRNSLRMHWRARRRWAAKSRLHAR
jgi:uncharacterized protein (DUF362 family)